MTAVDPALRATRTTCPYCGVGCGVLATSDNSGGAAISGDPEHPANFGRLCSKGSALGETLGIEDRLLYPMIRCSKGTMERVAWSDALDHVAHRFAHIIARDGPGAVALRSRDTWAVADSRHSRATSTTNPAASAIRLAGKAPDV